MSHLDTLLRSIDELTPEEKQRVVDYIRGQDQESESTAKTRTPGLFPGIWISDDFDDELPDPFWFGEE